MAGIIKVNQYQDFNGNTLFTSDGNGNLTTLKTNYPAFEAYLSSDQTISHATVTKVQIDTESFDTDSCYDNSTNYRFTPTVAGKYFVYSSVACDKTDSLRLAINYIYKNGSVYKRSNFLKGNITGDPTRVTVVNNAVIDMNGSTDYLEVFARIDTKDSSSPNCDSLEKSTMFGAYRIGS